jgi:hypothetical protein
MLQLASGRTEQVSWSPAPEPTIVRALIFLTLKRSAIMTNEQLNEVARQITCAMYETGTRLKLVPADLAAVVSVACCNVNFWAHGRGGVEQMRTAADVAERHLLLDAESVK